MYGTVLVLCAVFHSGKSTIMIAIAFSLLFARANPSLLLLLPVAA